MKLWVYAILALASIVSVLGAGCSGGKSDPKAEAPLPFKVERVEDRRVFEVDHPKDFNLCRRRNISPPPN